ncbi:MAG TPA: hypothetical protein VG796_30170 [Verrucomicrobiales bacterium]|nr:hypothetical protein [Verrucomicrobiales bacterium]
MRRLLPLLAAALLGIAAGWFIRGASPPPEERKTPVVAAVAAAPVKETPAAGPKDVATAWRGTGGSAGATPFTSLEELIALFEGVDMEDELGMIEMMAGIPRLLATDLATAKRLLAELESSARPQGELKGMLAVSLLGRWMLQDPESAIEFGKGHLAIFGASPDEDMLEAFTLMGMTMMAKKNPASARSLVELLPKDSQEEAMAMVNMIEAANDPEGALSTLPPDRSDEADSILGLWARRDPQAALRWAMARPEEERGDLLETVVEGWAKRDWKAAAQWAAANAPEDDRDAIYAAIGTKIPEDLTHETADAMLAGLPQPLADLARLTTEQWWGDTLEEHKAAGDRIVEILKRNAGDKNFQAHAVPIVEDLMKKLVSTGGGQTAVSLLESIPEGAAKGWAPQIIALMWAEKDPEAASAWVNTLPAGEARDGAVVNLIHQISDDHPQQALQLAKALPEEQARTEHLGEVLRKWLPKDPFAAMKAIESLPEEDRSKIWETEQ